MAKISEYKSKAQLEQLRASEPLVNTNVSNPKAFEMACSFYHSAFSTAERVDWLRIWFQEQNDKKVMNVWWSHVKKQITNGSLVPNKTYSIARMKSRNITIPEDEDLKFQENIKKIHHWIDNTDLTKKQDMWEVRAVKRIPAEKQITLAIDELLEAVGHGKKTSIPNDAKIILEYMKTFPLDSTVDVNSETLKKVQTYYQMQLSCIEDDLNYAKEHPNEKIKFNPNTSAIIDFMKSVLEACAVGIVEKGGAVPKKVSEKKKVITVEKITKKASQTYEKHNKELNVTSLTPDRVLGKKQLIMFDSHSRVLKIVNAEEGKTLTFANTALVNVDISKSVEKKISKTDFVKRLMDMSKTDMMKEYKLIKNTEYQLKTVYINKTTMFLKVY